jgi:hypothetical protein
MILALDISTSITGIVVMDYNFKVLHMTACDTRNAKYFPHLLTKAVNIMGSLTKIEAQYDIKHIFIEESLQSFRSGFSSAKTLSVLSKINGIVSFQAFSIFGLLPEYLSASGARRKCGIKVPKGQKGKAVAMQYNIDKTPEFSVEYTRAGNPKPKYYDISDALIIARAGGIICQEKKN